MIPDVEIRKRKIREENIRVNDDKPKISKLNTFTSKNKNK